MQRVSTIFSDYTMEPKKGPYPLLSQRITGIWLNRRDYITAELQPSLLTNNHKPSMAQDMERGRMLEIDPILTAFARLARAANVPTPNFDAVLALLAQRAMDAGLYGR